VKSSAAQLCEGDKLGYVRSRMGEFFSSLFAEMGARRRRLRSAFGDRGQALIEFLLLGGLAIGSLGLYVRAWMPAAAPWGLGVPLVFALGFLLIEARRQSEIRAGQGAEQVASMYDWAALLWSFACALAGIAAFVVAWNAQPPAPPVEDIWSPPENAVSVEISP
jgi:hypothetical protein